MLQVVVFVVVVVLVIVAVVAEQKDKRLSLGLSHLQFNFDAILVPFDFFQPFSGSLFTSATGIMEFKLQRFADGGHETVSKHEGPDGTFAFPTHLHEPHRVGQRKIAETVRLCIDNMYVFEKKVHKTDGTNQSIDGRTD